MHAKTIAESPRATTKAKNKFAGIKYSKFEKAIEAELKKKEGTRFAHMTMLGTQNVYAMRGFTNVRLNTFSEEDSL